MQATMPIDEQEIGPLRQTLEGRADWRELPECQVGWNVGEVDVQVARRGLLDLARPRVHEYGGGETSVSDIGHIDSSPRLDLPAVVLLHDSGGESLLFGSKFHEEAMLRQLGEEPIDRSASVGVGGPFVLEGRDPIHQHGTPVRAHDAVRPGGIRMVPQPFRDRPRCADVAEGTRDRAARRDASPRNPGKAGGQRLRE